MNLSCNSMIAKKYGAIAGIIFNNIAFWVKKNQEANRNIIDGKAWTFNSVKAFAEQLTAFTARQVRFALEKLRKAGLIIAEKLSKDMLDHTLYYTLSKKAEEYINSIPCSSENSENQKKDELKEIKSEKEKRKSYNEIIDEYTDNQELRKELKDFIQASFANKNKITNKALEKLLKKLNKLSLYEDEKIQIVENSTICGYRTFYKLKSNNKNNENKQSYDINKFDELAFTLSTNNKD